MAGKEISYAPNVQTEAKALKKPHEKAITTPTLQ